MPQPTIGYTSLNIRGMLVVHNELAPLRGVPKLKTWHESYCKLAERVALLRTQKPLPVPAIVLKAKKKAKTRRRKQPIRDAIMEALAFVSHYEDAKTGARISKFAAQKREAVSIGLPYSECVKRVRRRFPNYSASPGTFRVIACRVREGLEGHENCKLPHKRPHGTKGKTK